MKTWSDSSFHPVEELAGLRPGRVIAEENGESRLVHEIAGRPGWLAKLYKQPLTRGQSENLRNLVYLPTRMSLADQALVDRCMSWPVARIVEGSDVVGVVMAQAPEQFYARIKTLSGRLEEAKPLVLDWLVTSDDRCTKCNITPATVDVRIRAMLELLSVGALFARHDLVYADWSYRNAFWGQASGEVFVIDMDTCGIGTRDWVESPGWEDPLFQDRAKRLNVRSDRYKIAMLTVRCLTGTRKDPLKAHGDLVNLMGSNPFTDALERALTATHENDRPSPEQLMEALAQTVSGAAAPAAATPSATGAANVTGTVPVRPAKSAVSSASGNVTGSIDLRGRSSKRVGTGTTAAQPATGPVPEPVAQPARKPKPMPEPVPKPTWKPAPTPSPKPTPAAPMPSALRHSRPLLAPRPHRGGWAATAVVLFVIVYCIAHFALGWV